MNALPTLIVFFYRNLLSMSSELVSRLMGVLLECLSDENIEVREMASKMLSGVVRCSQRQSIIPLKVRARQPFMGLVRLTRLPPGSICQHVAAHTAAQARRSLLSGLFARVALCHPRHLCIDRELPLFCRALDAAAY